MRPTKSPINQVKKQLLNILKLSLSLGLGVALIWWFVSKMSDSDKQLTIDAFKRADYFWIILAPCMGLVSNFSRAQRWRLLLEPTGFKPGFANTWFSVMMMYFFNLFFPRLGEVTRCTVLARYENVPLDKSLGTMVIERLVDLITIMIIGSTLLFVERERLMTFFNDNILNKQSTPQAGTDFTKWIVLVVIAVLAAGAAIYIERKYGFARLRSMLKERMIGFAEGLKSIKNLKSPLEFVFHSVFIWLCYFLMIYWSFPALPETAGMGVWAGLACLFFGGFAIVATPGGIGAYPIAISKVLFLYGVGETLGYAFGSIVWAAQMASILIGGTISLILLAILNKPKALEHNAA